MENVQITVKGTIATIVVDLSKTGAPSSSGKTILVASTHGNASIPGSDVKIGLNAFRPAANGVVRS